MKRHTILLVDDDPDIISGLRLALRKEDFDVRCANSARQALVVLQSEPIELVISDHEMPGMKGIDFLAKVHEEFPDTVRFILTGHASLDMAIDAINKGAVNRFFIKPCNAFDLALNIRDALRHKDLVRQTRRLMDRVQRQDALLSQLERDNPGITKVERMPDGAIVSSDTSLNYDTLIIKLNEILGQER